MGCSTVDGDAPWNLLPQLACSEKLSRRRALHWQRCLVEVLRLLQVPLWRGAHGEALRVINEPVIPQVTGGEANVRGRARPGIAAQFRRCLFAHSAG